jgi:hypothetical protein
MAQPAAFEVGARDELSSDVVGSTRHAGVSRHNDGAVAMSHFARSRSGQARKLPLLLDAAPAVQSPQADVFRVELLRNGVAPRLPGRIGRNVINLALQISSRSDAAGGWMAVFGRAFAPARQPRLVVTAGLSTRPAREIVAFLPLSQNRRTCRRYQPCRRGDVQQFGNACARSLRRSGMGVEKEARCR